MNSIEKLLTKFIPIKKRLETKGINELTKEGNSSILSLLNNQKEKNSFIHPKKEKKIINKPSITNNYSDNPNLKTKDKFYTKKFPEQKMPIINNIQKDLSPMNNHPPNNNNNNLISSFNKNPIKYEQQNTDKNFNKNTFNKNSNNITITNNQNTPSNINLLTIDNSEISIKDAKKAFEEERNEEVYKKNMAEKNRINQLKNKNYHDDNNIFDNDLDDCDLIDDAIDNLEKKLKKNIKNEQINNKSLALNKKESLIDLNQNFNIFDMSKLMGVEDEIINDDANYDDKNESFDNNDNNNNFSSKNTINKFKKSESENKKNKFKEKNEKKDKIENENNNNDIIDSNYNDNNSEIQSNNGLKFRIIIGEDNESLKDIDEEKNRNNESQSLNNSSKNENLEIIKNKKKKENHINPIKKNNIKSKSCLNPNINNIDSRNNSKIKNKIIIDDEDEENYDSNNKNRTNDPFLSPMAKNEKSTEEAISSKKDSLITNKGNKFTFFLDNDISSKKIPPPKINKDKNKSNSTNNINDNYDLSCINSIKQILLQIDGKLKKEKSEKKINEICYKIINNINNNKNDVLKRKKSTYIGILKILGSLFSLLYDIKAYKMYINEIFQILSCIQKYFKNIKKYDVSINNITFYYKKKMAFKYIYSSFELKNYGKKSLKELTEKNNNEENINMIKFIKTYKRYIKSSEYLNKDLKEFKEKINNPLHKAKINTTKFQNKYESCSEFIQISPNFMSYLKLFNHYGDILDFYKDYKDFKNDLEKIKKDKTIDTKREKSVQINRNGLDAKAKNRDRSRYKEREREKEIEKAKEKDKKNK